MARERRFEVWKVATIGHSAAHRAREPIEGVMGSWMWIRSNRPRSSQPLTRALVMGPKLSRATEPL